MSNIGDYIKNKRTDRRISVKKLSEATGINENRIRTIERGAKVSLKEIGLMGDICGYSIEDAMKISDEIKALVKIESK